MQDKVKKVLLVDDDALLRELLGLLVEKHGYMLNKAENGQDAITLVDSFRPDLIVLDVMMPIMDGREFLTWLQANSSPQVCVLVLTSMTDEKLHKELYELGAARVETKPISLKILERTIQELLGERPPGA